MSPRARTAHKRIANSSLARAPHICGARLLPPNIDFVLDEVSVNNANCSNDLSLSRVRTRDVRYRYQ